MSQAEQVWLHCKKELLEITQGYDYSDFYRQHPVSNGQNKVESDLGFLNKRFLHKAITDLPSHRKHMLLKCLDKELIQSQTSERNSALINWHKLFIDWSSIPRRYLLRKKNAPKLHQYLKHKDTAEKLTTAAPRRARVPSPPEPSSSRTTSDVRTTPESGKISLNVKPERTSSSRTVSNAPAKPGSSLQTLNVKYDKSSPSSPQGAGTSPEPSKDPTEDTTSESSSSTSLFEVFAIKQIEKALEQLKIKEATSPAPQPSQTKNNNSPSPSPTEKSNSPAPSPPEKSKSPAPSPEEKSKSPAPSPSEKSKAPEPSLIEKSKSPETSPVKPQPKDHVTTLSEQRDTSKTSESGMSVVTGCSVAGAVVVALFLFCGIQSRRRKNGVIGGQTYDEPSFNLSAGIYSSIFFVIAINCQRTSY